LGFLNFRDGIIYKDLILDEALGIEMKRTFSRTVQECDVSEERKQSFEIMEGFDFKLE